LSACLQPEGQWRGRNEFAILLENIREISDATHIYSAAPTGVVVAF